MSRNASIRQRSRRRRSFGEFARLIQLHPLDELGGLTACYQRGQSGLHLLRDVTAWETSILENPRDLFLPPSKPREAYIRLAKDSESLGIVESASADVSLAPPMFRAVAAKAEERATGISPGRGGVPVGCGHELGRHRSHR